MLAKLFQRFEEKTGKSLIKKIGELSTTLSSAYAPRATTPTYAIGASALQSKATTAKSGGANKTENKPEGAKPAGLVAASKKTTTLLGGTE